MYELNDGEISDGLKGKFEAEAVYTNASAFKELDPNAIHQEYLDSLSPACMVMC
jgi:hypothetical protein